MKRLAILGLLALTWPAVRLAADDSPSLFDQALEQLVRQAYVGDTSAAERYLQATLEQNPNHLEARWQLLYLQIVPFKNLPLPQRASMLGDVSPEFNRVAELARRSKQTAFLHFLTAIHAALYNDFDRALPEIDQAAALDPRSARYLTAKARIVLDSGRWTKSDATLEKGIALLNEARELLRKNPSPFVRDEYFDFYLAGALEDLSEPRWKEVAEHDERFLEINQEPFTRGIAWNQAARAYMKLGDCARAKADAEKALEVMKSGPAQETRRYAEFCLEMQKMGLIASR